MIQIKLMLSHYMVEFVVFKQQDLIVILLIQSVSVLVGWLVGSIQRCSSFLTATIVVVIFIITVCCV